MIDRVAPTRRPEEPAAGLQKWRTLLFLHWEVPVATLRALVPEPLSIDTFEGRAFVGLVPFTMQDVRPLKWLPAMPGASDFHETNVRTYVHLAGKDPGVWFFSLDAANTPAVLAARRFFHLPYYRADMELEKDGDRVRYRSARRWPEPKGATLALAYDIGEDAGPSEPGTLQHFLAERYFLYAKKPDGSLVRGQVHHTPYPLKKARVKSLEETFLKVAGIDHPAERGAPDLFSEGVDVEIYGLKKITGS